MDIENMNDFEIRQVLEDRQKKREEEAEKHRQKMAGFVAKLCEKPNQKEIIVEEAKRCLSKGDFEYLMGDFDTRIYGFSISIDFCYHSPRN